MKKVFIIIGITMLCFVSNAFFENNTLPLFQNLENKRLKKHI
jgi:hypothetical protein